MRTSKATIYSVSCERFPIKLRPVPCEQVEPNKYSSGRKFVPCEWGLIWSPKEHLIKIRTSNSTKFLEILNSNKTPIIFSLPIPTQNYFKAFKFRAQAILNVFQNTHTSGFGTFDFQNIFIYSAP